MSNASTSTPSRQRARLRVGTLAGAGILVLGLVAAPHPDIDAGRTEVLAVQFTAFSVPALRSGAPPANSIDARGAALALRNSRVGATNPVIGDSAMVNRQATNVESAAVTTYDTAEDLNFKYWVEDFFSSIAAIPGILLIGVPVIAVLAAGVVIGSLLAAYDAVAAALGLPSRNAQATVAGRQNFSSTASNPLQVAGNGAADAGNPIAESTDLAVPPATKRFHKPVFGDLTATEAGRDAVDDQDPTAPSAALRGAFGSARTIVKQVAEDLGAALTPPSAAQRGSVAAVKSPITKSPITNRHLLARSAGTDSGSLAGPAHKTPVRDGVVKAAANLKKAVNQFSNRVSKGAASAVAGHPNRTN